MDFVAGLNDLQVRCGVDNLKMSDYGINREEFEALASNARETMEGCLRWILAKSTMQISWPFSSSPTASQSFPSAS